MNKILFALAGAALVVPAASATARHYSNSIACSGWRGNECVAWNRLTRAQAANVRVGTVFGPHYTYYTGVNSLPKTVVTQYKLTPQDRYVSADGYVYVVDPHTFAVTKVIAPST